MYSIFGNERLFQPFIRRNFRKHKQYDRATSSSEQDERDSDDATSESSSSANNAEVGDLVTSTSKETKKVEEPKPLHPKSVPTEVLQRVLHVGKISTMYL